MCRIGSTWEAVTHYALVCLLFVGCTLVPFAYHTYATWLVVRIGAKGAVRTFAFCVELTVLALMAATVLLLVWYGDPSLFGSRARQKYDIAFRTLFGPRTVSNTFTHVCFGQLRQCVQHGTAMFTTDPALCSKEGLLS